MMCVIREAMIVRHVRGLGKSIPGPSIGLNEPRGGGMMQWGSVMWIVKAASEAPSCNWFNSKVSVYN